MKNTSDSNPIFAGLRRTVPMLTASVQITKAEIEDMHSSIDLKSVVRQDLCHQLAEKLAENMVIETIEHREEGSMEYRASLYPMTLSELSRYTLRVAMAVLLEAAK